MAGDNKMDVDDQIKMDVDSTTNQIKDASINRALAEGKCIFQHKVLGKGSYGEVVLATHKVTKKHYAVKMMPILNDERIKYQRRELGLLTTLQLSCRNIIQYFNSWLTKNAMEDEQILCIQMELCWLSLDGYISNHAGHDKILYKYVFPQILVGLHAIHAVGWVHRDIHPGNILIGNPKPIRTQDIVIKIADFGLARQIGEVIDSSTSLTVQPTLDILSPNVGNRHFRAPELSTGKYDYKIDMYSAGIVLYVLCLEDRKRWKDAIQNLRAGNRDENVLRGEDEVLFRELLYNLLKLDPAERPNSRDALDVFVPTKTDGFNATTSMPTTNFLARREGEAEYNRCHVTDRDSLAGIKVAVEKGTGISKENQILRQESVVNGKIVAINIDCDENVKEMFQSAEKADCKVQLTVLQKRSDPFAEENPSSEEHRLAEECPYTPTEEFTEENPLSEEQRLAEECPYTPTEEFAEENPSSEEHRLAEECPYTPTEDQSSGGSSL